MLKKSEVLEALAQGGRIMIDSIYRTAHVLNADGDTIDTCRYDTAERIERSEGYTRRNTDWYAAWFVEAAAVQTTNTEEEPETMTTETMTREERRAMLRSIKERRDMLTAIHEKNSSPAETVAELIGRIGYQAAREAIAEAVRGRGSWDGRISDAARIWAGEITTAADRETLLDNYLVNDDIHPAHIDQIARAAAEYDREKPNTTKVFDARYLRWLLLRAIAADNQDRALTVCIDGFQAAQQGAIREDQRRDLSRIYDAWERSWVAPEDAEAAQAEAAQAAPEQPEPKHYTRTRKAYLNSRTGEDTSSASQALRWHRAGDDVQVNTFHNEPGETGLVNVVNVVHVAGAVRQKPKSRQDENWEHCKAISDSLEAYGNSDIRRCPDCGEEIERDWSDVGEKFRCPSCGRVNDCDDWEPVTLYDYFSDVYDIEFRCDSSKEYRSCQIMVACGGPNIYIDTGSGAVELYWWTESARYHMPSWIVDEIDYWAEEYWKCM